MRRWSVSFVSVGIGLIASVGGLALLMVDGYLGCEDVGCKEGQLIDGAVEGETERQVFVVATFKSNCGTKGIVKLSLVVRSLGWTGWSHDDEHLILKSSLGSLGEYQVIRPVSNGLMMILEELLLVVYSIDELLVHGTVWSLVDGGVSELSRLTVDCVLATLQCILEEIKLDEVESVIVQLNLAAVTIILGSVEDPDGCIYILGGSDVYTDGEGQVVETRLAR